MKTHMPEVVFEARERADLLTFYRTETGKKFLDLILEQTPNTPNRTPGDPQAALLQSYQLTHEKLGYEKLYKFIVALPHLEIKQTRITTEPPIDKAFTHEN
jgi:hypothetical protein